MTRLLTESEVAAKSARNRQAFARPSKARFGDTGVAKPAVARATRKPVKESGYKKVVPTKYRAVRAIVDGITFASKKEAGRYRELKALDRARKICSLELQPEFACEINGVKICSYRADFRYWDKEAWCEVIEDVKGFKTPAYRIKKKLMLALFGIEVVET